MLKSLWRRPSPSGLGGTEEQALARYFRDEGLHAELEALCARSEAGRSGHERACAAARSYLAA